MKESRKRRILFIGGIHGVGKSTFSAALSRQLGVPHHSSGALIVKYLRAKQSSEKRVADVTTNQNVLLLALNEVDAIRNTFVLDGHFCVWDTSNSIHEIPLKTFQGIAPIAVLVLRDAVQHIRTRLLKRDKVAPPDGVLSALQEAELRHARNVSEKLSLPCQIFLPAELPSAKHFAETQLTRL